MKRRGQPTIKWSDIFIPTPSTAQDSRRQFLIRRMGRKARRSNESHVLGLHRTATTPESAGALKAAQDSCCVEHKAADTALQRSPAPGSAGNNSAKQGYQGSHCSVEAPEGLARGVECPGAVHMKHCMGDFFS